MKLKPGIKLGGLVPQMALAAAMVDDVYARLDEVLHALERRARPR